MKKLGNYTLSPNLLGPKTELGGVGWFLSSLSIEQVGGASVVLVVTGAKPAPQWVPSSCSSGSCLIAAHPRSDL